MLLDYVIQDMTFLEFFQESKKSRKNNDDNNMISRLKQKSSIVEIEPAQSTKGCVLIFAKLVMASAKRGGRGS